MLKIVIGIFIVIGCFFAGASYSVVYKKRMKFYELLSAFNSELKRNLVFRRENVSTVLKSKPEYALFADIYKIIANEGEFTKIEYLTPDENEYVCDYFSSIGKRDGEAEEQFLDYSEEVIKSEMERCAVDNKKYKSLGEKLGLSFGLVIFVLIL